MCAGREWSDWSQELRIPGEELRWKFTSDGSVNGWGWLFTVYPIMPAAAPLDMLSDRTILSRPSIDLVTCLLDFKLENTMDRGIIPRLAASLAACAQLSCLSESSCSSFQFSSGWCLCTWKSPYALIERFQRQQKGNLWKKIRVEPVYACILPGCIPGRLCSAQQPE